MAIDYLLLSMLSEAAGDEEEPEEDVTDTGGEEDTGTEATDDTAGEEEPTEDETETEEDENTEENQDEEPAEDDFSMDPTDEEDNEPPPDGLTDPDDDGSGDEEDITEETNVQTNILNLSKLDRALAKRKCYNDFMDLRTSVTKTRNIIDVNEVVLNPDVRNAATGELDTLYTQISDYLQFKFSINNYEENMENHLIFMKRLTEIVDNLRENGLTKV